jgi:hypothetical protein
MTDQASFNQALSRALAHSVVYFLKAELSPNGIVDDARNDGKSSYSSPQTTNQQQAAGQGGGAGSNNPTIIAGASSIGGGSSGVNLEKSNLGQGNSIASGGTQIINISNPDVNALESNTVVSTAALGANANVSDNAIAAVGNVAEDAESVALAAINGNTATTVASQNLAATSIGNALAVTEQIAQEQAAAVNQLGNNALTSAQNEILGGVTPAQQLSTQGIVPTAQPTTLQTVAAYVGIGGAIIALLYFLRRKP